MQNQIKPNVEPKTACKIGIIGSKEVGKTTLANLLNGYLKSLGASADLVQESAQKSPWKLNAQTTLAATYWLLGSQIAAEALICEIRQFAICDRTIIDLFPFLTYSVSSKNMSENIKISKRQLPHLKKLIENYLVARPYDFLIYVPIRPELWEIYSEPSDMLFQAEIDREFRSFLKELGINYYEVSTLYPKDRVDEIMILLRQKYHFKILDSQIKA